MSKGRRVVCDIEANGLDPDRIWIIVAKDYDTGELFVFDTEEQINVDFVEFTKGVDKWIGHFFLRYDLPVLNKLIPNCDIHYKKIIDTEVLSRLANPVREGHSLEYWGNQLGYPKQEHEDWSRYSPEMRSRCITDVELNMKLFPVLMQELDGFSSLSIKLEHEMAHLMNNQKVKGFKLDVPKAQELHDRLKGRAQELRENMQKDFRPVRKLVRNMVPKYNKDGAMSKVSSNALNNYIHQEKEDGSYDLFVLEEFNPNSPTQIVQRMNEAGWKPTDKTKSGNSWKINEKNLSTLPDTAPSSCKNFVEFKVCETRWKVVAEWLHHAKESYGDGRVHGSLTPVGTITHRMSHQNPNMGNLPSVRAKYGEEVRACLTVPDDLMLCGCDASGIQLRVLAHYMNDEEYIKSVLVDPHTANQKLAGLETRDQAKKFIYAWLLGAGDAKIGEIIKGTAADGRRLKERFLKNTPALARLVKEAHKNAMFGFLKGLDGRRVPIKSAHYSLSSYLQGGEAVIMKYATALYQSEARKRGIMLDPVLGDQVGYVHDEWQVEVKKPKDTVTLDLRHLDSKEQKKVVGAWLPPDTRIWSAATKVDKDGIYTFSYSEMGELMVICLKRAGELLKLNCPIDGEYKIGRNWAETH